MRYQITYTSAAAIEFVDLSVFGDMIGGSCDRGTMGDSQIRPMSEIVSQRHVVEGRRIYGTSVRGLEVLSL